MVSQQGTNNKDFCLICNQPSIKNYPLKKCTSCDKLVHRRCAQTSNGQVVICSKCALTSLQEKKETKKGGVFDNLSLPHQFHSQE